MGWESLMPISCPSALLGLYREAVASNVSYPTEARPKRGALKLWRSLPSHDRNSKMLNSTTVRELFMPSKHAGTELSRRVIATSRRIEILQESMDHQDQRCH